MAVVHRNGRAYIYRSIRRASKVTSEYGGSGETAWLIGRMEAIDRDKREFDHWLECEDRRRLNDLEKALEELTEQARSLARDALTAAGYHQHDRGKWRRRRANKRR
jgi:hypothetical protein